MRRLLSTDIGRCVRGILWRNEIEPPRIGIRDVFPPVRAFLVLRIQDTSLGVSNEHQSACPTDDALDDLARVAKAGETLGTTLVFGYLIRV